MSAINVDVDTPERDSNNDAMHVEKLVDDDDAKAAESGDAEGSGEDDGEEEEYEIEAILDDKRGMFGSRMGYFVKWKGYDEKDNSWVDENDASGAKDLIREYWDKKGSKTKGRGSNSTAAAKPAPKKAPAKRTKAEVESEDNNSMSKHKKAKNGRAESPQSDDAESEAMWKSVGEIPSMQDLVLKKSWETVVKSIDTVERNDEGALLMYFTLHNGTRCKEDSKLCRQKFPQKILDFYEGALKWRDITAD